MLDTIAKKIYHKIAGRKKYQRLFEILHKVSLIGMHIGQGSTPDDSGEVYVMNYIKSKLVPVKEPVIFDVGANIGKYTLLLKKVFGANSIIHSFEPSYKTFQKLKLNTSETKGVHLHNMGLGDETTNVVLYSNWDESGLASVYQRRLEHYKIEMKQTEEITIMKLDDFCEEHLIRHIHFLKMDVEGHELKVLRGAENLLTSGGIDFIQFEFGGTNIDSRTFFQDFYYLLKKDYNIYRIVKDGLQMMNDYDEIYEIFLTINYFAEKKTSNFN